MKQDQALKDWLSSRERVRVPASQQLLNLADAMCDDVMSMSGEEIRQEFIELGEDIYDIAASFDEILKRAKIAAAAPPGQQRKQG